MAAASPTSVEAPQSDGALLARASQVLSAEASAIMHTRDALDAAFVRAAHLIHDSRGRLVVTGMGKSGIVARKIAATFASTGTPSFFVHAAEAVHGDLGMLASGDVVLALSNSGETEEIVDLLPVVRLFGTPIIAMVGNTDSTLARQAEVVLSIKVPDEGCPIGLAPMSSTTTMLALGDALAAVLMEMRGFGREDFAMFHPRGSLGRKLLTKVADIMHTGDRLPRVSPTDPLRKVITTMISSNLGLALATDGDGRLAGVLSDGDIKRLLDQPGEFFSKIMRDVMTRDPITVRPDALAETALQMMEENPRRLITVLPVVDGDRRCMGLVRMHDILARKIR